MTVNNDMTKGTPWKLIVLFTLPILAGQVLQQLYNTVDSVIVGRFVSQTALGAVGTCAPLTTLFVALAVGFSTGACVIAAQFFGGGKAAELRRAASTVMVLVLVLGIAMTVLALVTAEPLLRDLLKVPEETLDLAVRYYRIYALGLVFQFVYNAAAALLRAVGDSRSSLLFVLISSAANIALDLLLVAVIPMGVAGAAAATVISQALSAGAAVVYMLRRYESLRHRAGEPFFDGAMCRLVLKLGIPVSFQQCVMALSSVLLQRLVNGYGSEMMAAYTAAGRLESYAILPCFAFSSGMATYVGQNMGAGETDRIRRGFRQTLAVSLGFCVALSLGIFVFGGALIRIFSLSGNAYEYARAYVSGMAAFFVLFAAYQVAAGTLQGAGDVTFATGCTFVSLILRVAASYFFAFLTPLGYRGLWWAMPVAWASAAILAYIRYFGGRWKNKGLV